MDPNLVKKHLSSINNIDYLLANLPNIPQKIVYCSSIAVYGFISEGSVLYDENSILNIVTPYAISKRMGELLLTEWANENNCALQIVRIGSVYAEEEIVNNGFLGYAVKSAREKKVFRISISPQQMWNYVYVDDVSQWILNAVYLNESPGVINLTATRNYSTHEIMEVIKNLDPSFTFMYEENNILSKKMDKAFCSEKRNRYLGMENYSLCSGLQKILKIGKI